MPTGCPLKRQTWSNPFVQMPFVVEVNRVYICFTSIDLTFETGGKQQIYKKVWLENPFHGLKIILEKPCLRSYTGLVCYSKNASELWTTEDGKDWNGWRSCLWWCPSQDCLYRPGMTEHPLSKMTALSAELVLLAGYGLVKISKTIYNK